MALGGSGGGAGGEYAWVIAVALCFLAAVISNLGLNFQKMALTRKSSGQSPARYRPLWALGTQSIASCPLRPRGALAWRALFTVNCEKSVWCACAWLALCPKFVFVLPVALRHVVARTIQDSS
jgi:hypothetical protein